LKTIQKWTAALIIIVSIVGIVVATTYLLRRPAPSISLAPTTFVAVQGASTTFNVYGLESNGVASIYFGDGEEDNTTSILTHTYQNSGRYLVGAVELVGGQAVASTFNALETIQVTPKVDLSLAPLISLPVITFDVARNPSAPVIRVGDQAYLNGGFFEPPSGANVKIDRYDWDFGNGATKTVDANSTSFKPAENPAVTNYNKPGLYAVTLTVVTQNTTSTATCRTSVEQTVAVGSGSQPYALFLYAGIVPNPSVINVAEYAPSAPLAYSLDPQIGVGGGGLTWEPVYNIFSTLLIYNGSSTTQFIPMAAARVPSIANGGISPDYKTYTFQIRTGLKFSNGDPLAAYDVWYSMIRCILFSDGPNSLGSLLTPYLVPGVTSAPLIMAAANDTAQFDAIMNAVTYSNSSNTVTFKLVTPTIPQLFFTLIALPWAGPDILDASWLQQNGAGITFTPASFYAYQNQANCADQLCSRPNVNSKVQWAEVASGPYMVQNFVLGQSVTLVPNPGFPGVPSIPVVNNTVVIHWVKDPQTAYDLFVSGQADIVEGLATNYLALIPKLVADGKAAMYQTPTLTARFFSFNLNINVTRMKASFGQQYNIPSNYFANTNVREAFAYAFDYTTYIDDIQGNNKYGIDFGDRYVGLIIPGLPYHVPPSQLQNVPIYDLAKAKHLLQQSGQYDIPINFPVQISPGNTVEFAGVQMWAAALNSIDPNIVMTPVYHVGAGFRARAISVTGWFQDYPYTSDVVDFLYGGGPSEFPILLGWNAKYLNSTGHADEAAIFAQMNSLIQIADSTTNTTLAAEDYKQVEQLAISLYMYVYTVLPNQFWVVRPYMNGYQGQISYQENPMAGGNVIGLYFWWVKTCGSVQACSGRNIGP
jgi:peptide/nickel transport system substrate-binding protein